MVEQKHVIGVLREHYTSSTFEHCERTTQTAVALATLAGCDCEQAETAAWFHDYAKELDEHRLVELARGFSLSVTEVDLANPYLLHGPVGACLVREELGRDEPWLYYAISRHTYGSPDMNALDKIIYLADVIEPGRAFVGLDEVREAARTDIEKAFRLAYEGQMRFLLSQHRPLHPVTIEVWNRLVIG